ncbi:MAG TPA: hypothetical protein V6D23_25465 [Candidatus Obscuribacterales bacterium]
MDPHYHSSTPPRAREEITRRFADGRPAQANYYLAEEWVGERSFDDAGRLEEERVYRQGRPHGWQYFFHADSEHLMSAEPYANGLPHGTAYQWAEDCRLIGCYQMVHGTGTDLWWGSANTTSAIQLSEVHPLVAGSLHGIQWWLGEDGEPYEETYWKMGSRHGIERCWNGDGGLRRGYPRYYIDDLRVTKRQYLRACASNPELPPFRAQDNQPRRQLPPEIAQWLNGIPAGVIVEVRTGSGSGG